MSEPARCVLDASALIALFKDEPGAARVGELLERRDCAMSTVNLAEFVGKLVAEGATAWDAEVLVAKLPLEIAPFTRDDAAMAGGWIRQTRPYGLSLGDRACLAAAWRLGAVAVTADRVWQRLSLGVVVECIRAEPVSGE